MSDARLAGQLLSLPLRWRAGRRRALGRYDKRTLSLFRRSSRHGEAHALLDYLLFRRDLGHPLHPRFVPALLTQFDRLGANRKWQAAALISEVGEAPDGLWKDLEPGPGIAIAAPNQHVWQGGFGLAVRTASQAGGVCVVGNGAALIGSGLGDRIDAADLVVRFNRWQRTAQAAADIGTKTSVWVTSPSYDGPRHDQADWVAVTGPEMSFRLRRWGPLEDRMRRARPVLTVPLGPWRELVAELGAPPSAGVLMLAWLRELNGGWHGIHAAGIGSALRATGRYHQASRRLRASSRHHWTAEGRLVERWHEQGLTALAEERPA